jgi:hypothetical protein
MTELVREVVAEVLSRTSGAAPAGGRPPLAAPARPNYQRLKARERLARLAGEEADAGGDEALAAAMRRSCLSHVCEPSGVEAAVAGTRREGMPGPPAEVLWQREAGLLLIVPDPDPRLASVPPLGAWAGGTVGVLWLHQPTPHLLAAVALGTDVGVHVDGNAEETLYLVFRQGDARSLRRDLEELAARLARAGAEAKGAVLAPLPAWSGLLFGVEGAEALGLLRLRHPLEAAILADGYWKGGGRASLMPRGSFLVVAGARQECEETLGALEGLRLRLGFGRRR